jgi:hypothetical protein
LWFSISRLASVSCGRRHARAADAGASGHLPTGIGPCLGLEGRRRVNCVLAPADPHNSSTDTTVDNGYGTDGRSAARRPPVITRRQIDCSECPRARQGLGTTETLPNRFAEPGSMPDRRSGAIPSPPVAEPVPRARPDDLLVIAVGLGYRILRKSDDDRAPAATGPGLGVAQRPPSELAAQADPALFAGRLTNEPAASRERLRQGRLEEWSRLRRALHDGVSPAHDPRITRSFGISGQLAAGPGALLELEPLPRGVAGGRCSLSRPHSPAWTGGPAPVTYPWAQLSNPRGSCPRRPPPARRSGP